MIWLRKHILPNGVIDLWNKGLKADYQGDYSREEKGIYKFQYHTLSQIVFFNI